MNLKIEPSQSSPLVDFSVLRVGQHIQGVSIPVDAFEFYKQIHDFLDANESKLLPNSEFHFDLKYFNTSSSKALFNLLQRIQKQIKEGKELRVVWYFSDDDDFMLESGEEFEQLLDASFEFRKN